MERTGLQMSIVLVGSLLLFACGGDEPKDEVPMTEILRSVSAHLTKIETMASSHEVTVGGATDLSMVQDEEASYKTMMLGNDQALQHHVEAMVACRDHDGRALHTEDLDTAIDNLTAGIERHEANILAAVDLTAASNEETRHQTSLAANAGALLEHLDMLELDAHEFTCPPHEEAGDFP